MMDQRLDHGCSLDQSCKFPVLISLGLVQSQSFSSLATGLPNTKCTRSVTLSRDVKFDEESFPSRKSAETCSTPTTDATVPTKSTNLIPLLPVPVDTSTTLPICAETSTQSDNDKDDVEDLLDQTIIPKIE